MSRDKKVDKALIIYIIFLLALKNFGVASINRCRAVSVFEYHQSRRRAHYIIHIYFLIEL